MSRHFLLATLLTLALSHTALADDGDPAASEQNDWDRFTPLIETFTTDYPTDRSFATVAIGISHLGERRYWQVGNPVLVDGEPVPSESTIYQIGSVTKTFTGLLLADMVEAGLVSLDTTLGEMKPADVELSEDMAGITLRELATHTSGLPRLSGDLAIQSLFFADDPYARYSSEELWNALEATSIPERGDRKYQYSNLAMGLLGQLLADRLETDYATLLRTRVTEPLQMNDTVIELSESQLTRLAHGHTAAGTECNIWTFDALAGCGALSSTTADLLTYLEAELHPEEGPLGPAIRLSQQTHYEVPDGGLTLGLAWHMLPTSGPHRIIAHDGGTNGFVSFTGFIPEAQTAVVILCNSGDALSSNHLIGRLGVELLVAAQADLADAAEDSGEAEQPVEEPQPQP
jgi:CubicO group peptidase (beta-lactamase class C family)